MIPTEPVSKDSVSDWLDLPKIRVALAADATDLGICREFSQIQPQFELHSFDCLPSTNTQLWQMLAQGAKAGTVVLAQRQSAGRGQRDRTWYSAPGGLYLSLALEPDWPIVDSAQLTCMSAWGIATALNNLGLPIQIKWPNDLFFEGKKLGGILTETKLAQPASAFEALSNDPKALPRIKQAVIGVGINWHNPTPETGITLAKILELIPECTAKNKINCLEMLVALTLKGILQGTFCQQRLGSQVFMKAYQKLLTPVSKVASLDSNFLALASVDSQMLP
jgi:BirA family transcriptional regulator, biotin operon repressor / biotin---[acetyl-CoA-carboxylase] ligase